MSTYRLAFCLNAFTPIACDHGALAGLARALVTVQPQYRAYWTITLRVNSSNWHLDIHFMQLPEVEVA